MEETRNNSEIWKNNQENGAKQLCNVTENIWHLETKVKTTN